MRISTKDRARLNAGVAADGAAGLAATLTATLTGASPMAAFWVSARFGHRFALARRLGFFNGHKGLQRLRRHHWRLEIHRLAAGAGGRNDSGAGTAQLDLLGAPGTALVDLQDHGAQHVFDARAADAGNQVHFLPRGLFQRRMFFGQRRFGNGVDLVERDDLRLVAQPLAIGFQLGREWSCNV